VVSPITSRSGRIAIGTCVKSSTSLGTRIKRRSRTTIGSMCWFDWVWVWVWVWLDWLLIGPCMLVDWLRHFSFDQDESNGLQETDLITNINPSYMGMCVAPFSLFDNH
jgi:hypothetical protein